MTIRARQKTIDSSSKTTIMGVVNMSPDSFSGDGIDNTEMALIHAKQLLAQGADIIDIGGESTRPGSTSISSKEERARVLPVVSALVKDTQAIISVDTYKVEVAADVLKAGAHIINDITGLADRNMAKVIAEYGAGVVIMHMQGQPKTMQQNPHYDNVIDDIRAFFCEHIQVARLAGIGDDHVMLDPGIGFGKTLDHNLAILENVAKFATPFADNRRYPILIGTSRKSFLAKLTSKDDPNDRVFATAASVAIAIVNGADMIRVHDVAAMRDVTAVADRLKNRDLTNLTNSV